MKISLCVLCLMMAIGTTSASLNAGLCSQVSNDFGVSMSVKAATYTGYDIMQSVYERRAADREFVVHSKHDNRKLVNKMVENLEKFLRKKQEAVKRSVKTIENGSEFFDWKAIREPAYYNVQFLNANPEDVPEEYQPLLMSLPLKSDARFTRAINYNTSVVQVPFDIYSKNKKLVRAIESSKVLNYQFQLNKELDPSLKWQYFGSTNGFLRIYPGFQWKVQTNDGHANIYDCRKRMWYTEAASFPKDVLILVDMSGSMKGLKMSIATHVVSTILETLNDNDFFNVLAFNNSVQYVDSCLNDTLVPATTRHKKKVFESLMKKEPNDIAELGTALEFALKSVVKFQSIGLGSACYSAIMVITDGSADNYQQIIEKSLNNTDNQIRIFTYVVGRESNSYMKAVEEIACNNAGYFHQIESKNDAYEKVFQYLTVMNRPQAVNDDHQTIWTKSYYDTTQGDDGFGLVCTLAIPTYLKDSPSTLLGVMATDIPVNQLLDVISIHKAGVNAYVFMITNNGNVVFHPRLITKFTDNYNRQAIKENYNSIDIGDLEAQDSNSTLRNALIQQATAGLIKSPKVMTSRGDWKRPVFQSGTFHHSPVFGTPYSIGVFIPDGYGNQKLTYGNNLKMLRHGVTYSETECDTVNEHLMKNNHRIINRVSAACSLNFSDVTLPDSWHFCHYLDGRDQNTDLSISQLGLLLKFVLTDEAATIKCDGDLLNSVLFDSYITAALHPLWAEHSKYNSTHQEGIQLTFITTRSGVTRQFWHEDDSSSRIVVRRLLGGFGKQTFPDFYRRAASYPDNQWVYTPLPTDNYWKKNNVVLITRALKLKSAILGVVGMLIKYQEFSTSFWEQISVNDAVGCSLTGDSDFDCYVIDDYGRIVISNELSQSKVGEFIGDYEGGATRHLVAENIFTITTINDNGTVCQETAPKASAMTGSGMSTYLANPFLKIWSYTFIAAKSLSLVLMQVMWSMFSTRQRAEAQSLEPIYRICDISYPIARVNKSNVPYTGSFTCAGFDGTMCLREIGFYGIANSNLFMFVVEKDNQSCVCQNDTGGFYLTPKKRIYQGKLQCESLRKTQPRRRPVGCKEHHYSTDVDVGYNYACSNSKSAASALVAQSWSGVTKNSQKGSSASYLLLSISWFLPYLLVSMITSFNEDFFNPTTFISS